MKKGSEKIVVIYNGKALDEQYFSVRDCKWIDRQQWKLVDRFEEL